MSNGRAVAATGGEDRPHTEAVRMVLHGAAGRIEHGRYTILVRGRGDEVLAVWLNGGVYCDDRRRGSSWFRSRVASAVADGGTLVVEEDCWPTRYQGGRFR